MPQNRKYPSAEKEGKRKRIKLVKNVKVSWTDLSL